MMADRFGYGEAHKPQMQVWYRRLWFKFYRRWVFQQPVRSSQEYNVRCEHNLDIDQLIIAIPPPSCGARLLQAFQNLCRACQRSFRREVTVTDLESRMPVTFGTPVPEKQTPSSMFGPPDLQPPLVAPIVYLQLREFVGPSRPRDLIPPAGRADLSTRGLFVSYSISAPEGRSSCD